MTQQLLWLDAEPNAMSARANRERGRPIVRRLVVDEETPGETLASGQRQRPEVDSQRNPQLATGGDARWPACFELPVQADWFLPNNHCVPVFVGQIESPLMFHVGLIPRDADADGDRDLLWSRADDPEPTAQDEQLAVVDLDSIGHQDDRSKRGRVEHEVGLIHEVDPIGRPLAIVG